MKMNAIVGCFVVPGAVARGEDWELARYGCDSFLSINGSLSASWSGDIDAESLTVESADFTGEVAFKERIDTCRLDGDACRRLAPGEKVVAVYRETVLPGAGAMTMKAVARAADCCIVDCLQLFDRKIQRFSGPAPIHLPSEQIFGKIQSQFSRFERNVR